MICQFGELDLPKSKKNDLYEITAIIFELGCALNLCIQIYIIRCEGTNMVTRLFWYLQYFQKEDRSRVYDIWLSLKNFNPPATPCANPFRELFYRQNLKTNSCENHLRDIIQDLDGKSKYESTFVPTISFCGCYNFLCFIN